MVATPSKLVAFAVVATYGLFSAVSAAPLETNPVTPIGDSAPLTTGHPAFGGPLRGDVVSAIVLDAEVTATANSITITNSSAVEVRTAGEGARRHLEGASADMQKISAHFGKSLIVNYKTLIEKYSSGDSSSPPWPASYWPVYQDSINARWTNEPSPAEKYATAFNKNVKQFMDTVSYNNGIDQVTRSDFGGTKKACTSKSQCAGIGECAIREGKSSGYCIPAWWGICHAWAPAANWEPEPKCDVVKNGVTFHPFDLKGLITAVYDGAQIETVFTGSRFNGPDSPAKLDQYGRYTDAFRRDLGAGFFHIAISNIMGVNKHSFVVDVTAGAEVWNQPVRSYRVLETNVLDVEKASSQYFGTTEYPFNSKAKYLAYTKTRLSWIIESYVDGPLVPNRIDEFTDSADYEYFLELDANYDIIGGEWLGPSRYEHPDFLWFAKAPPKSSTVTAIGLSYKEIRALIDESIACKNTPTPAPTTVQPTVTPATTAPSGSGGSPTTAPVSTQPTTGKPTSEPSNGKPTAPPTDGKPTKGPEPTPAPETSKPADGKPTKGPEPTPAPETSKPADGKPTKGPEPTPAPETSKPADGKPTKGPEPTPAPPSGNGKPTPCPKSTKPSKGPQPTPAPESSKPTSGKPTPSEPTPAPPSGDGKPTPCPETTKPSKGPEPTPAPESSKPTSGKPTPPEPTPAPESSKPTSGKPTPPEPTPAPESSKPSTPEPTGPAPVKPADPTTPAPVTTAPAGKPTPPEPTGPAPVKPADPTTPAPVSGDSKPTPAPSTPSGKPTPPATEPTPAPETSKPAGKPTPPEPTGPAPVKPPTDDESSDDDDVPPTPTTTSPSSGAGKPTPSPTTPTDDNSDDDDLPPTPTTAAPTSGGKPPSDDQSSDDDDVPPTPTTTSPSSGAGKPTPSPTTPTDDNSDDDDLPPTPTTGAPVSESTPSPTVKPKKPKNCHA